MAPSSNGLGRQSLKLQMQSSNLAGVTVAIVQRLVHQIVALKIRVQFPVVTLGAGRIAAIAADCKSADFGLRWFESNPAHFTFACPRWLMVPSPLRSGRRKADVHWTSCAPLRWCAATHRWFESTRKRSKVLNQKFNDKSLYFRYNECLR